MKSARWNPRQFRLFLWVAGVLTFMILGSVFSVGEPRTKYRRSRLTSDESEVRADKRRMLLTTGEDKPVDLDFEVASHDAITVGNDTIVMAQLVKLGEKRQVVFKPKKAGETTVTVRDADGTIRLIFWVRVTGSSLLRIAGEVRDLLRDIEGINIRIVGPKVIIEGEVLVPADYGRLLTVLQDKAYTDFVMNLTTLSPLTMQVLAKRIEDDIKTFAPNVRTRVVNGKIFLEGTVDSAEQAKRSVRVANLYLPEVRPGDPLESKDGTAKVIAGKTRDLVQEFILINPPPPRKQEKLVRVTVHFVELAKDYNKIFGFKWQPGFAADPQIQIGSAQTGAPGASGLSFSATLNNLIPKLTSGQAAGYARVINTGTVIVRSGQAAKLVQQKEFPFLQMGPNGQVSPGRQPVGLSVAVTPLILGQSEDIQLDLAMDQTNVVGRVIAGTPPTTATHKVETKLYVKSNESAAVAGVTSGEVSTNFNKDDPRAGSFEAGTEPLFNLLHTKAYTKNKSQFVIFITPQIIENASEGSADLQKNFRVKVK